MVLFDVSGFDGMIQHDSDTASKEEEEKIYSCVRCGTRITSVKNEMAVDGAFKHSFTNPHGYMFTIGCFAAAQGCSVIGPSTSEFTWFPGHSWRIGSCGVCGLHLGWEFRQSTSRFFGLILSHLVRGEGSK